MQSYQQFVVNGPRAKYHGGSRLVTPSMVVVHATGGDTADGAMTWLNRVLANGEHKASYHYLIDKPRQQILRFCPVDLIAYHAGVSAWPDAPMPWQSVNRISIGVAFANDNGDDQNLADDPLTPWQQQAGLWLVTTLCRQYQIPANRVLGHREVSPGRKTDPLPRILSMDTFRAQVAAELNQ